MELHPRLHSADVKQKQASISLDEFSPTGETTRVWWELRKTWAGVEYTVYPEGLPAGGVVPTVAEALQSLAEITREHYGPLVVEPGYSYGLDFIDG